MVVILFYLVCFVVIWWGFAGYFIFLYLIYLRNRIQNKEYTLQKQSTFQNLPTSVPNVTILVPCYNEENLVENKIKNLLSLDYPKEKLKIIFIDGKSTDNTFNKINDAIKDVKYIKAVQSNVRGKILQLNYLLPKLESDIIINTDMDGRLKENTVTEIIKEFQKDESVGVVGAFIIPENCSTEERYHWDIQNRIRVLESLSYSSSVIIAVCYGFKSGIIKEFPSGVIADDVYLPFETNLKGYRVVYSTNAVGFETRTSKSKMEFIKHKFRKTNANIIETLKYIGRLPEMLNKSFLWTIIFTTRAIQILVIPSLVVFFILFSLFLIYNNHYKIIIFLFIISVFSILISHKILHSFKLSGYEAQHFNIFVELKTNFMLGVIMLYSLLIYPFYKQDSSYKKINCYEKKV